MTDVFVVLNFDFNRSVVHEHVSCIEFWWLSNLLCTSTNNVKMKCRAKKILKVREGAVNLVTRGQQKKNQRLFPIPILPHRK